MIINTYFITDHFEEYFVPSEKSSYMDNPRRSKSKIFERTHLARISVAGIIKIHFAESSCQLIVFRCQRSHLDYKSENLLMPHHRGLRFTSCCTHLFKSWKACNG